MDKMIIDMLASLDINTALILLLIFRLHMRVSKLEFKKESEKPLI
jgi:hypothetical protein